MIIPALKKTYKGQIALDFPGTEIRDGSIVAICGINGCGKSTLAKILAGIVLPDDGRTPDLGMKVGYLTQAPLAFKMSVRNNLLQNSDRALSKEENKKRADELIRAVGIEALAGKNAQKLSGGETARMALARLLMKKYDLLILDEPTAAVDVKSVELAEKMILNYHNDTGCTVILVTHSAAQAERLADRIIYLGEQPWERSANENNLDRT
ncbi:MAG: ABC transporter ATP-binding protein [Lachnospiraceae bacterium]|nr:ABC transporter ATP-binding protein [Lachnospiraceae bacterium]